jgi:hypothetical protein
MTGKRLAILFNVALAMLYCVALPVALLSMMSADDSWVSRVSHMPNVLAQVTRAAPIVAFCSILLPFAGALVCAATLVVMFLRGRASYTRAATVSLVIVGALTIAATIVLRDLSWLFIACVPLAFASYVASRADMV